MLIGIDILDTERLRHYDREKLARIFTSREMDYLETKAWALDTTTGLFCAKEAFFKAIGTGIIISRLHDVEVLHSMSGAPYYKLAPSIIKENGLSTAKINLSISHTKDVAVAVCVIVKIDSLLG